MTRPVAKGLALAVGKDVHLSVRTIQMEGHSPGQYPNTIDAPCQCPVILQSTAEFSDPERDQVGGTGLLPGWDRATGGMIPSALNWGRRPRVWGPGTPGREMGRFFRCDFPKAQMDSSGSPWWTWGSRTERSVEALETGAPYRFAQGQTA